MLMSPDSTDMERNDMGGVGGQTNYSSAVLVFRDFMGASRRRRKDGGKK